MGHTSTPKSIIAPIVLMFLLLQRFFIRGLTMGAQKG